MGGTRYCAYNETTDSFLCIGVTSVDTSLEPLKALKMLGDVDGFKGELGLWLAPRTDISVAQTSSSFDLIHLDEGLHVVHVAEMHPAVELAPFEGQAASVLVLSPYVIRSSRTHPGDQIIICDAEEMVRRLVRFPTSASSAQTSQTGSLAGQPRDGGVSSPSLSSDSSKSQQTSIQAPYGGNKLEITTEEIDSVISRVLSLGEETRHPLAHLPVSTAPVPVTGSTEPPARPVGGNGGSALSPSCDHARDQQAGNLTLDGQSNTEVQTWEQVWLSARFQRLEEEMRPARIPASTAPGPETKSTESLALQPNGNGGSVLLSGSDRVREQQGAIQPFDGQETVELWTQLKNLFSVQLQRWELAARHLLARIPASTAPGPGAKSRESLALQSDGNGGSVSLPGGDRAREQQGAIPPFDGSNPVEFQNHRKYSLLSRFVQWVNDGTPATPRDRRRSDRRPISGLVAFFWTGAAPVAHKVRDISDTGYFLFTEERWSPETLIRMTLQKTYDNGRIRGDSITVVSKVVRSTMEGVGYEYAIADREELRRFL